MDVVWKLGLKGPANNWELRMSMRSFWKNYSPTATYWIIGYIPDWIDQLKVRCLPWPDPYAKCKDANLLHKALRLAMEPKLSDPFIFCSDDQILLQPYSAADFKVWYDGEIPEVPVGKLTKWQRRLHHTGVQLRSAGFPSRNYEGHVPYPLYKSWVREVLRFDFSSKPGMCVHSTIFNCNCVLGAPLSAHPIRAWLGKADLAKDSVDARLASYQFACLTDSSLQNSHLVSRLEDIFGDSAPWELDGRHWPRLSHPDTI